MGHPSPVLCNDSETLNEFTIKCASTVNAENWAHRRDCAAVSRFNDIVTLGATRSSNEMTPREDMSSDASKGPGHLTFDRPKRNCFKFALDWVV